MRIFTLKNVVLGSIVMLTIAIFGFKFFQNNNTRQMQEDSVSIPQYGGKAENGPTTDSYSDKRGSWNRMPTTLQFIGKQDSDIAQWDISPSTQFIKSNKDGEWKKTPTTSTYTGPYGTYSVTPTTITFDAGEVHLSVTPSTTTVKNADGTAVQTPTTKSAVGSEGSFQQTPTTKSYETDDESWMQDSSDETEEDTDLSQ